MWRGALLQVLDQKASKKYWLDVQLRWGDYDSHVLCVPRQRTVCLDRQGPGLFLGKGGTGTSVVDHLARFENRRMPKPMSTTT